MADDEWSEPLVVDRLTGQALWPDLRGRRPANAAPGAAPDSAGYIMMQSYSSVQQPPDAGCAQGRASQLQRDVSNDLQRLRRTVSACAGAEPANLVANFRADFDGAFGMERPRSEALLVELQAGLGHDGLSTGATGSHAGNTALALFSSASGHIAMGFGQPPAHAAQPGAAGADWPGGAQQAQHKHFDSHRGFDGSGSATPSHGGGSGPTGMDTSSTPQVPFGGAAVDQAMAPAEPTAAETATSAASPAAAAAAAARQAEADAFHNAFGARLPRLAVLHAAGSSFGGGASSGGGAPASTDWGSGSPLRRVWASSLHEAGGSGGRLGAGPNSPSARAAGSPIAVRGTPTKHVGGSQGGSILSPRVGPLSAGSPGFAAASAQLAHLGLGGGPGSGGLGASRHLRSSSSGGGIGAIAAACLSPQFGASASAGGGGSTSSAASEQRRLALSSVSNLAQLRETVAADGALPPREKQNLLQLIEGAMVEQQQSQQQQQQQQQRDGAAGWSASGGGGASHPNQAAGMTLQQQQQQQPHTRCQSTPSGPMSAPYGLARPPPQQPSPPPRPAGPHRLSLDAASRAAAAAAAAATAGRLQSMSTPFGGASSVAAAAAAGGVGAAAGAGHPSEPGLSGVSGSGALSTSSGVAPSSGPVPGAPTPPGGAPPGAAAAGFGRHSSGMDAFRPHAASLGLPESSGGGMGPGAGGILSGGGGYGSAGAGANLASSISAASASRLRRCSGGMSPPPAAFGEGPGSGGGYMQGYPPQQLHQQQQQQQQRQQYQQQQQYQHEDQQQLLREVYTAFAGGAAQHDEQQQQHQQQYQYQHQQPHPMRTSAGGGGGGGGGTGLIAPTRLDSAQSSRSLLAAGSNRVVTSGGSGSGSGSGGTSSGGAALHGMEGVVHQGGQAGEGAAAASAADRAAGAAGSAAAAATSGSRSGSEGPRAPRPSRAAGSEGGSQVSSATGCSGDSAAGGPAAGMAAATQSQQQQQTRPQLRTSPQPQPSSAAATPDGPRSSGEERMLPESMGSHPTAPTAPPPEPAATAAAVRQRLEQQPVMGADHAATLLQSQSPRSLPSPPWQAATPPRPAPAMVGAASSNDLPRLQQQQQQQQQQLVQPGAVAISHGVTVSPLARQMLAMPFDVSGRSGPANSTGSAGGGGTGGGGTGGGGTGLATIDVRARMLAGVSTPTLLPSYQQQQQQLQSRFQPRPPPNFASMSHGWGQELHSGDVVSHALGDNSTRSALINSLPDFPHPSFPHPPDSVGLGGCGGLPDMPLLADSPQARQQQQQSRFNRSHQHQHLLVSAPNSSPGELAAAAAAQPSWRRTDPQLQAPYSDDGGFALSMQPRSANPAFGGGGDGGMTGAGFGGDARAAGPPTYNTEPGFPQSPLPHHPAATPPSEFGFRSPHSRQQQQQPQEQRPSGYSTPTMQAGPAHLASQQPPGATFRFPDMYAGQQPQQQQEQQWQIPREMQRAAAAAAAAAAQARAQAQAQAARGFAGARLAGSAADLLGPTLPPAQALQEALASAPGRLPAAPADDAAAAAAAAAADQDGDLLMMGGLGGADGDGGHTGLLRDVWNAAASGGAPVLSAAAGGRDPRAASGAGAAPGAAVALPPLPAMLEDGDVDALDSMLDELLGVGDLGDVGGGPEAEAGGGGGDMADMPLHLHLHLSALQDGSGGSGGRRAAGRRRSSSGRRAGEGAAGSSGGGAGAGGQAQPRAEDAAAGAGGMGGVGGGGGGKLAACGSSELMGVVELGAEGGGGGEGDILALGLGDGTDDFMSGF